MAAVFDSEKYRILILSTLDLKDPEDNSFLVHELVHVLQFKQQGDAGFDSCQRVVASERAAYAVVQTSYLELAEPTIAQGGAKCVEAGATAVTMLPYFLSAGIHVREDMLEAQAELAERFPGVTFRLAPHLGLHPLLLDVVEDRAREAEAAAAGSA